MKNNRFVVIKKKTFGLIRSSIFTLFVLIPISYLFFSVIFSVYNGERGIIYFLFISLIEILIAFSLIMTIMELINSKLVLYDTYFEYTNWMKKKYEYKYSEIIEYVEKNVNGNKYFVVKTIDNEFQIPYNVFDTKELRSRIYHSKDKEAMKNEVLTDTLKKEILTEYKEKIKKRQLTVDEAMEEIERKIIELKRWL